MDNNKLIDKAVDEIDSLLNKMSCIVDNISKINDSLPNTDESWWDWEADKAVSLPPVGVECEWGIHSPTKANWKKCTIDYIHGDKVCVTNSDSYKEKQVLHNVEFRPLNYATRKAEIERKHFADTVVKIIDSAFTYRKAALDMFDAGFRMPEDK